MTKKRALVTGITGQDGSYLAELLLDQGYQVHGIVRRTSGSNIDRIAHLNPVQNEQLHAIEPADLVLHHGDITDGGTLGRLVATVRPDEVYNLAAQSHVHVSFAQPEYTSDATAFGTLKLLEAIRDQQAADGRPIRFYQASSSEMFGKVSETPQNEATRFHPRSPYAVSKVYAHWMTINFRESYDLHASCGILFNHESPRRGETFVTRKITRAATRIKFGRQEALYLGNLDARRDWGFAGDYVRAMWLMLQQDQPSDYVVATGETHSVREFCELTFGYLDLDYREFVKVDPAYYRPAEVDVLQGDYTRAREILGWRPSVDFPSLVKMMVDADLELAERE